jgi:hypothetical protein
MQAAGDLFDKAGLEAGEAIKEMEVQIVSAELSLTLKQKVAAKMAKKEEKKREAEMRVKEEQARAFRH